MEYIFHEKQEGSLCAQHCLNALLQGSYFTAVDLADIGRQLDETERQQMAEAGTQSEEYRRFMEQPSNNFDDSGFFSIQVIQSALDVWNLQLIPYKSSDTVAKQAQDDPRTQTAYICNFREHWFCIRKLGDQWFNLNSSFTGAELISDTYLSLFLTQLQAEGYSIFIVRGHVPDCDANQMLKLIPAVQKVKPKLLSETGTQGEGVTDEELKRALEVSREDMDGGDKELQRVLELSKQGFYIEDSPGASTSGTSTLQTSTPQAPTPTAEEIRQKRLAYLENKSGASPGASGSTTSESSKPSNTTTSPKSDLMNSTNHQAVSELSEEEMLKIAIAMSMDEKNT